MQVLLPTSISFSHTRSFASSLNEARPCRVLSREEPHPACGQDAEILLQLIYSSAAAAAVGTAAGSAPELLPQAGGLRSGAS